MLESAARQIEFAENILYAGVSRRKFFSLFLPHRRATFYKSYKTCKSYKIDVSSECKRQTFIPENEPKAHRTLRQWGGLSHTAVTQWHTFVCDGMADYFSYHYYSHRFMLLFRSLGIYFA